MPRLQRQESPTGYYHVMTRGINKEKIFETNANKEKLIKAIREKSKDIDCRIYAYCIMDNHLHLLVNSGLDNLSLLMKKINISYAIYYNKKYNRIGPVFQDRFKSELIFDDRHFLGVIRYIHNNPIKANIVAKPQKYSWSSLKDYINKDDYIIHNDAIKSMEKEFKVAINFIEFHQYIDDNIYLDIEEDWALDKKELSESIVKGYLKSKNLDCVRDLTNSEELITKLLDADVFSYREISKLTMATLYKVYKSNKKNRPQCLKMEE